MTGLPVAGQRLVEQLLETVGDTRECRVHDERMHACREALGMTAGDILPVADARDAGAPNLRTTQLDSLWLVIESGPRGAARCGAALLLA
jgi:hypothetical protein